MFSWDKAGDRVAMVQMNAELRHAQLELLSAQCATDRLRLRFSAEDVARYAQRDVLRRALSSANALHDYYNYLAQHVADPESLSTSAGVVNESQVQADIEQLVQYLGQQRDLYYREGRPLAEDHRQAMAPFFSSQLLDRVRIALFEGEGRISTPPFFAEVRSRGFTQLPDLVHMRSVTFEDVLVFHEPVSLRYLFHALVHTVQYEVLGLRRYAELFVRSFLRTRSHITVPLEAHAFSLEVKFAGDPSQSFSVDEKVRLWANQGRYGH